MKDRNARPQMPPTGHVHVTAIERAREVSTMSRHTCPSPATVGSRLWARAAQRGIVWGRPSAQVSHGTVAGLGIDLLDCERAHRLGNLMVVTVRWARQTCVLGCRPCQRSATSGSRARGRRVQESAWGGLTVYAPGTTRTSMLANACAPACQEVPH